MLRSLVDPSTVPSSALPFSGRDLFIAAHNAHVQAFENVSKLSNPMSDYLCRLATGGGIRTRALFQDVDETLLRIARPIMLEGIANYITRADLMDRAIILALEPLTDRKTERALHAEFERLRPGMFGALLDQLVMGIRQLPDTHLASLPRMADFATWAVACGLDGFEQAYAANRQAAIDVALDHDVLARAVRALWCSSRVGRNRERTARPPRRREPNPEREGLVGRTEPPRANAAYRWGRRASPPDQRPARNHDHPAYDAGDAQFQSCASRASLPRVGFGPGTPRPAHTLGRHDGVGDLGGRARRVRRARCCLYGRGAWRATAIVSQGCFRRD